MKREDLEKRPYCTIIASNNFPFYSAPEADAVMDAMEARIKELESDVKKWKQDNKYLTAYVQLLYNVKDANSPDIISTDVIAVANRLEKLESENARLKAANFDLKSHFDVLKEDYEELKAQVPKWISVKDSLPPEKKEIIGCTIKGNVMPCWFTEYARVHLSHWMPLPPPPTTEESSATEKEVK